MKTTKLYAIGVLLILILMGGRGVVAATATCGNSLSLTATQPVVGLGGVTCVAWDNDSNIVIEENNSFKITPEKNQNYYGTLPVVNTVIAGKINLNDGSFTIAEDVWKNWKSIYLVIKQGTNWGVFLVASVVTQGTYYTVPGSGTGYSHYFAVGGDVAPAVPVPAAVWLFGSGIVGLMAVARRRNNKSSVVA